MCLPLDRKWLINGVVNLDGQVFEHLWNIAFPGVEGDHGSVLIDIVESEMIIDIFWFRVCELG